MSVWKTSYLLYGYKIEDKKELDLLMDDHYEDLMEEKPYSNMFNNEKSDQQIVFDGMCGRYMYVGEVLASIDEDEDAEWTSVSEKDLANLDARLKEHMKNWPDYLLDVVKDKDPMLYFFIHAY